MSAYTDAILADSPEGFWLLDEGSGTTAADSSGNGHHGTYNGTPTFGQTGPGNVAHTATRFNNPSNSAYVGVPSHADLHVANGNNAWSLEGWFKSDGTGLADFNGPTMITVGYDGSFDYALGFVDLSGGITYINRPSVGFYNGSSGDALESATAIDDALWKHIVGTYDGTNLRLYLNGALTAGPYNPGFDPGSVNTTEILLMKRWDTGGFVDGYGFGMAIYSYELTPTQVGNHWSAAMGQSVAPALISQAPTLFAFSILAGQVVSPAKITQTPTLFAPAISLGTPVFVPDLGARIAAFSQPLTRIQTIEDIVASVETGSHRYGGSASGSSA